MPYDKTKPYSCPCCGYWNGDMKYDYYKHKEPLIKDEKIRKAVRAWAEANNIIYYNKDIVFDHAEHRLKWINVIIEFDLLTGLESLEDGKTYTIAELCGTPPEPIGPTFIDLDERIKEKEI